jgi:hypothetical protein
MNVGLVSPASDTSLSMKFEGLAVLLNGRQRQPQELQGSPTPEGVGNSSAL